MPPTFWGSWLLSGIVVGFCTAFVRRGYIMIDRLLRGGVWSFQMMKPISSQTLMTRNIRALGPLVMVMVLIIFLAVAKSYSNGPIFVNSLVLKKVPSK